MPSKSKVCLFVNVVFIPIATGLFLVAYLIFQFLGEKLGFSPVINIYSTGILSMEESVLMFVVIIALAQIIALNLTFYLINLLNKTEG